MVLMTHVLSNRRFEASIAPLMGGAILYFRSDDGTDFFSADLDGFSSVSEDVSCYPLAPFGNRLKNSEFRFGDYNVRLNANIPGKDVTAHGQAWQTPMQVFDYSKNSVTMYYDHEPGDWPWSYRFIQTVRLSKDGLIIRLSVRNTSDNRMPCGLGLHPSIPISKTAQISFTAKSEWLIGPDGLPAAKKSDFNSKSLSRGARIDFCGDRYFYGFSGEIKLTDRERGVRLTVYPSPNASDLILFSRTNKNSLCIEPMTHAVGALNALHSESDVEPMGILEPNDSMSCSYAFIPEKIGLHWSTETTAGAYATEVMV